MWYDLKRQFIGSAARTLWAGAWEDERERLIEAHNAGEIPNYWYGLETAAEYVEARGWPHSMQGVELTEAAPPTPDYARLEAAILLGKLEQANGCELATITQAAQSAECRTGACNEWGDCLGQSPRNGLSGTPFDHAECAVDVTEFASDVAMMAIGSGVSWTDEHEAFEVSAYETWGGKRVTRPFVVPHIEFSYEDGER